MTQTRSHHEQAISAIPALVAAAPIAVTYYASQLKTWLQKRKAGQDQPKP